MAIDIVNKYRKSTLRFLRSAVQQIQPSLFSLSACRDRNCKQTAGRQTNERTN